jgi:hypothetical protein
MRNFELTSLRVADGGHQRAGSLSTGTQYNPRAVNSFPPLPAGSIYASGAFLESPDPLHPALQKFILIQRTLLVVNTAAALVFAVFLLFAKLP